MVIRMIAVTTNSTSVYPLSGFARPRPPAACPNFLFTCTPSTCPGHRYRHRILDACSAFDWPAVSVFMYLILRHLVDAGDGLQAGGWFWRGENVTDEVAHYTIYCSSRIQAGGQWARNPMRPLRSAPLSRRAPQLCYHAVQFLDEFAGPARPKDFRNLIVIPQRPLFAAFESRPHRIGMGSQIGENLAGVVEFVRRRHEACRGIRIAQMLQVLASCVRARAVSARYPRRCIPRRCAPPVRRTSAGFPGAAVSRLDPPRHRAAAPRSLRPRRRHA